jgi:hypothetical protein
MCKALLLVDGGIPFPPDDILQPPGHAIQHVLPVHTHEVSTSLVCTVFVMAASNKSCSFPRFFLFSTDVAPTIHLAQERYLKHCFKSIFIFQNVSNSDLFYAVDLLSETKAMRNLFQKLVLF